MLGGLEIPHDKGLDGHSDADVLCHAIADALLGAAALGDIGQHFPNSDKKWKDIGGLELLSKVVSIVERDGWKVLNIDATVIAEKPTIAMFRDMIRENLAKCCKVNFSCVSVKATTAEGLGSIGRMEGIAAQAIVSIGKA